MSKPGKQIGRLLSVSNCLQDLLYSYKYKYARRPKAIYLHPEDVNILLSTFYDKFKHVIPVQTSSEIGTLFGVRIYSWPYLDRNKFFLVDDPDMPRTEPISSEEVLSISTISSSSSQPDFDHPLKTALVSPQLDASRFLTTVTTDVVRKFVSYMQMGASANEMFTNGTSTNCGVEVIHRMIPSDTQEHLSNFGITLHNISTYQDVERDSITFRFKWRSRFQPECMTQISVGREAFIF